MHITNFIYFSFFPGILLVAVVSLASAQVRPPNYSPDAIPEMSFTCDFILMWSSYQVWHWENCLVASRRLKQGNLPPQGEYLEKTQKISSTQ